jgi:uncharacterized membrane protein YhaH (DUF805 family)
MNWYLKVWQQYADFRGRARRKEYWMFVLFNMLFVFIAYLLIVLSFAIQSKGSFSVIACLFVIYYLASIIPNLAVTVRRLHDIGNSGWWILISLVPFIGGFWLLILLCTDSQPSSNQWGANPKDNNGNYDNNYQQHKTNRYQLPNEGKPTSYYASQPFPPMQITIGRSYNCNIVVNERYDDVSRNHATILFEGSSLVLEDNSNNGSYINGQKLHHSRRTIRQNDQIRLGRNYLLSWNEINHFFPNTGSSRSTERWKI